MKRSDVVVFSPKTEKVLRIFNVESYNIYDDIYDIFNNYDVANIEDYIHDARLCNDRCDLNSIKEFIHERKESYFYKTNSKIQKDNLIDYLRSELIHFGHDASGEITINCINMIQKNQIKNIIIGGTR